MKMQIMGVIFGLLLCAGAAGAADTANWPDFRGPECNGRSSAASLPLHWSETENVAWKAPIHSLGFSTPVIWGKQIWMTAAAEGGAKMYALCYDLDTGALVHDLLVFEPAEPQRVHPNNSHATPSATIEAGRVYVHFGSHGTACIDTASGKVIWRRTDLNCKHLQGPVSSPFLYKDLLIVHLEGIDVQFFVALNKTTGETVWRVDRPTELYEHLQPLYVRKSYQTPVIVEVDGKPQLISNGAVLVTGHEPLTGKELWRVRYRDDNPVSRIVAGHGMLFVNTGGSPGKSELLAIRQGGSGDVTDTHVVWKITEDAPYESSPVLIDDLLYMVTDKGLLQCVEAKTGALVWAEDLDEDHGASLLYACGRIYLLGKKGGTTIIKPGRKFEVLAKNQLDGFFGASPAVAGESLILRSKTHLYRIEEK